MKNTPEEIEDTPEEVKLTLKSLNMDFQEFKKEVLARLPMQPLAPIHGVLHTAKPEDVALPAEPAKVSTTFIFFDRFTTPRVFSEADHGESWRDLANDFYQINQRQIRRREDL